MLKLSPSTVKAASRCINTGILKNEVNPKTGKRYSPQYSDTLRNVMNQGNYYETCIEGKAYDLSYDSSGFQNWLLSMNETKAKRDHLEMIRHCADHVRTYYDLGDSVVGHRFKLEFPMAPVQFMIRGEVDSIGTVTVPDILDEQGNVRIKNQKMIKDHKWTLDLLHVHDIEQGTFNRADVEQVVTYSMAHAIENSSSPTLFYEILEKLEAESITRIELANLLEEFKQTTEILSGVYLVCEGKKLPKQKDRNGEIFYPAPLCRAAVINIHVSDYIEVYMNYRELAKEIIHYMGCNGKYSLKAQLKFNPSQFTCMGVGGLGSRRGRCPYFFQCGYGRKVLGTSTMYDFTDVRDSHTD